MPRELARGRASSHGSTRRVARFALAIWLIAQLAACADLPDVALGQCGNAIVDEGEDCDTFHPYGKDVEPLCRAPGTTGECHLDCTPHRDGSSTPCPRGWGCDLDNLCRRPDKAFIALPRAAVGGIDALASGDFDGDGRADLLSRTPQDLVRRATLAFHYFDARGNLSDRRPLPITSSPPSIGHISGDDRDDVAFNDGRLGVLWGRQDRTWVPQAFTPYVLTDVSARAVGVADRRVMVRTATDVQLSSPPIVTLTTLPAGTGLYIPVPDDAEGQLTLRAPLPGTAEQLAGDLVTANVLDAPSSPCREVLLGFRAATAFDVVDLCGVDAQTGLPSWRPEQTHLVVSLEPPAPIDSAPLVVDVDADGHLDVLISGGGIPYLALGDGTSLRTAVPYAPPAARPSELGSPFVMPLAAGDFTGDGVLDFVMRDRLLISWRQPDSALPHYVSDYVNLDRPWTVAHIADLNGNGRVDVVVAAQGSLNATYFNGTGTQNLVAGQIPSGKAISQLTVGDFDGDLINDVAFVEASLDDSELDSLMVAYGALSQAPSAPVVVARVHDIEQLGRYGDHGLDTTSLVATRTVDGHRQTSLYFLGGSAVRIPLAPLELIAFSPEGSLRGVNALTIALGAFTEPEHKDVIALVSDGDDEGPTGFWLVPSIDHESPTPERLAGTLSPGLLPSEAARMGKNYFASKLYASSASADLDGDKRDELVWAMPYEDPLAPRPLASCGIEAFSVVPGPVRALRSRGLITLAVPCVDPQLVAFDGDGDGFQDLALLTGTRGGDDRKLFVLWNDRTGGFSSTALTQLDTSSAVPQAFTKLEGTEGIETVAGGRATPGRPHGLAFVTRNKLMFAPLEARAFGPLSEQESLTLSNATSLVAGDFNGDRAMDLAVADNGDLVVLNAKLSGNER